MAFINFVDHSAARLAHRIEGDGLVHLADLAWVLGGLAEGLSMCRAASGLKFAALILRC